LLLTVLHRVAVGRTRPPGGPYSYGSTTKTDYPQRYPQVWKVRWRCRRIRVRRDGIAVGKAPRRRSRPRGVTSTRP